jgi:hypothetical protein
MFLEFVMIVRTERAPDFLAGALLVAFAEGHLGVNYNTRKAHRGGPSCILAVKTSDVAPQKTFNCIEIPKTGLQSSNQTGLDQQPIEPPRLSAARTAVEQTVAAFQDLLLLGKGRTKRHSCRLLYD